MNDFFGNIKADSKNVSINVTLRSSTDNTEVTGKVAADVVVQYYRQGSAPVLITIVDLINIDSQYSAGGFKEVDSTNQKGLYRLDIPNLALSSGADWVVNSVTCDGCYVYHERYNLQPDEDKSVLDKNENNSSSPADFYGNIKADSKNVSIVVTLRNSTNNLEVTGKIASDMLFQYYRQGATPVLVTLNQLASIGAPYTPGGWCEVDSTNQKGLYRLDVPNNAILSGADWVTTSVSTSGCFVFHERYALQIDPVETPLDLSYNDTLELQSYSDLKYANTYFSGRLNTDAWDNSSLTDQQKSLVQATRIIDNLNIQGFKASNTQNLQFPRVTLNPNVNPVFMYYLMDPLYNDDQYYQFDPPVTPTPIVPEDIKIATCEIALSLLDERDPDMDYENLRIVSGGMSGSRVTYDPATQQEHIRVGVPSVSAWRRIRPYLVDPNSIEFRRVN